MAAEKYKLYPRCRPGVKVEQEIEKTEKSIKKLEELSKPVTSSDAIGHVSRMNSINNDTVLAIPLNNAKIKLTSLNKVMDQIGTADFGKCLKCRFHSDDCLHDRVRTQMHT